MEARNVAAEAGFASEFTVVMEAFSIFDCVIFDWSAATFLSDT
jgi:hypothetical protein